MHITGFVLTNSSKSDLINGLSLAIERRTLRLLNDPVQIGELQAYAVERLPSGLYRYSAPSGGHDDTVIALALAWYGTQHHGALISFVEPKNVSVWAGERDRLRDYLLGGLTE